jgi:hypothetical protein
MHKRSKVSALIYCILAVLVLSQAITLTAAEKPAGEARDPNVVATAVTSELDAMKEQIENQRKQIEQLQSALSKQQQALDRALSTINAKSAPSGTVASTSDEQKIGDLEVVKGELRAVADSAAQANQRLTKIESDTAATNKSNDAKLKQLGNFSFSGDARVRYEPFFQEGAPDRNRERVRLRFNVTAKLGPWTIRSLQTRHLPDF